MIRLIYPPGASRALHMISSIDSTAGAALSPDNPAVDSNHVVVNIGVGHSSNLGAAAG